MTVAECLRRLAGPEDPFLLETPQGHVEGDCFAPRPQPDPVQDRGNHRLLVRSDLHRVIALEVEEELLP